MKKLFTLIGLGLALPICSSYGQHSAPIASWSFDEAFGSTLTLEEVSHTNCQIENKYNRPEFQKGVEGNALRLDGFSTWMNHDKKFENNLHNFSISTWIALEAFPTDNGAIVNQQTSAHTGFSLEVNKYGILTFLIYIDNFQYKVATSEKLSTYQWHHIAGIVKQDEEARQLQLFVDGKMVSSTKLPDTNTAISFPLSTPLQIGIHNQTGYYNNIWATGVINGLIDELKIYDTALNQEEITATFSKLPSTKPHLEIPKERHFNDPHRPLAHPAPVTHWGNESYGLIWDGEKYHMFYQKNPNGPYHTHMHWGHLVSEDLVKWKEVEIALSPENSWDKFGIWSGHSILDDNGELMLFYTGVDGAKAGIGAAYPSTENNETAFIKEERLIAAPPAGFNMDFRDPFVWKSNGKWHMIVGAGIHNVGGTLATYSSTDLISWKEEEPLFSGQKATSGDFWEMPAFFQIGDDQDEYCLLINPIPTADGPAETLYWVGYYINGKFTPHYQEPKKFEVFNTDFLAPSITTDKNGNVIAIGIIPEARGSLAQDKAGWSHTFSVPRMLRLLPNKELGQVIHPNYDAFNNEVNALHYENISLSNGISGNFKEVKTSRFALQTILQTSEDAMLDLRFRSNGKSIFTTLSLDLRNNKVRLDRERSTSSDEPTKNKREVDFTFYQKDSLKIHAIVDNSVLEVFINDRVAISTRIYPEDGNAIGFDIVSKFGSVKVDKLDIYPLKTLYDELSVSEKELIFDDRHIPVLDVDKPIEDDIPTSSDDQQLQGINVYPNPNNTGKISIELEEKVKDSTIVIYDIQGKVLLQNEMQGNRKQLDISDLTAGIYFIKINLDNGNLKTSKFMVQ